MTFFQMNNFATVKPNPFVMLRFLVLSLLLSSGVLAQTSVTPRLDSLPPAGLPLDRGWKWHAGDDLSWAAPDYDDSRWESIDPSQPINTQDKIVAAEVGWLRLEIQADSAVIGRVLGLLIQQAGASEIYLNGRLLRKLGRVGKADLGEQTAFSAFGSLIYFTVVKPGKQILAVRYSFSKDNWLFPYRLNGKRPAFVAQVLPPDGFTERIVGTVRYMASYNWFLSGLFLMMAVLHLFFYFYNRARPINRTFGIAMLLAFVHFAFSHFLYSTENSLRMEFYTIVYSLSISLYVVLLLYTIITYFDTRRPVYFWILATIFLASTLSGLIIPNQWGTYVYALSSVLLFTELVRVVVVARKRQNKDAKAILIALILMVVCISLRSLFAMQILPIPNAGEISNVFMTGFYLSAAVALSILLAKNNGDVELALQKKLREVEALSAEKQQILASQNERLERQITERTAALNHSLESLKATQAQLIQSEKLASLGELTAGIAHEIQNPLNFVNNYAEVSRELLDELKVETLKNYSDGEALVEDNELSQELFADLDDNLAKITHHGKRAESIVNGMLQHTRRTTFKFTI